MQSARRTITSGNRVREVDLYSGFNKSVMTIYNEATQDDEAYQNAIKVSSYGKRNTTPKTNWVRLKCGHAMSFTLIILRCHKPKNIFRLASDCEQARHRARQWVELVHQPRFVLLDFPPSQ